MAAGIEEWLSQLLKRLIIDGFYRDLAAGLLEQLAKQLLELAARWSPSTIREEEARAEVIRAWVPKFNETNDDSGDDGQKLKLSLTELLFASVAGVGDNDSVVPSATAEGIPKDIANELHKFGEHACWRVATFCEEHEFIPLSGEMLRDMMTDSPTPAAAAANAGRLTRASTSSGRLTRASTSSRLSRSSKSKLLSSIGGSVSKLLSRGLSTKDMSPLTEEQQSVQLYSIGSILRKLPKEVQEQMTRLSRPVLSAAPLSSVASEGSLSVGSSFEESSMAPATTHNDVTDGMICKAAAMLLRRLAEALGTLASSKNEKAIADGIGRAAKKVAGSLALVLIDGPDEPAAKRRKLSSELAAVSTSIASVKARLCEDGLRKQVAITLSSSLNCSSLMPAMKGLQLISRFEKMRRTGGGALLERYLPSRTLRTRAFDAALKVGTAYSVSEGWLFGGMDMILMALRNSRIELANDENELNYLLEQLRKLAELEATAHNWCAARAHAEEDVPNLHPCSSFQLAKRRELFSLLQCHRSSPLPCDRCSDRLLHAWLACRSLPPERPMYHEQQHRSHWCVSVSQARRCGALGGIDSVARTA